MLSDGVPPLAPEVLVATRDLKAKRPNIYYKSLLSLKS